MINLYFGIKPAISLGFPFDFDLKELVKIFTGCQWDPKQKVWWVHYTEDQLNALLCFFQGKSWLDYSPFYAAKLSTSNLKFSPLIEVAEWEVKALLCWMLSLIYACGLRRSEVLKLKPTDVDSKRCILLIRQAKGKKDRITPLFGKPVKLLRQYYVAFKPYTYLFEGQIKGEQYSAESLQSVLKQALRKTGIQKPVTLHCLRHSYATHLLESGTDLIIYTGTIGHNSSKTTETCLPVGKVYTHVSTKSLQNIKNHIEDLQKGTHTKLTKSEGYV